MVICAEFELTEAPPARGTCVGAVILKLSLDTEAPVFKGILVAAVITAELALMLDAGSGEILAETETVAESELTLEVVSRDICVAAVSARLLLLTLAAPSSGMVAGAAAIWSTKSSLNQPTGSSDTCQSKAISL